MVLYIKDIFIFPFRDPLTNYINNHCETNDNTWFILDFFTYQTLCDFENIYYYHIHSYDLNFINFNYGYLFLYLM